MATGHTRYPVVGDEDYPVGVVELIDLLRLRPADDAPVSSVMREAVVLPTTMQLPVALDRMRQTRNELACVVDEYGNFDGILTIEDLTEEVIGEISDEHDLDIHEVVNEGENHWSLPGDVHLDEVERLIGYDLPRDDAETIAGLIVSTHGDLLPVGGTVRIDLLERASETVQGLRIQRWVDVEVVEVARLVPSRLVMRLRENTLDEESGATDDVAPETEADRNDEGVAR